jgi:hypothetical protein
MNKNTNPKVSEYPVNETGRYKVDDPEGWRIKCRAYEPSGEQNCEPDGIVIIGGGFAASQEALAPTAQIISDYANEHVVTVGFNTGQRYPVKVRKFGQVIRHTAYENPNQKLSFVVHSELITSLRAIADWIKEDPKNAEKVGVIVAVSGAGLTGETNPLKVALQTVGDTASREGVKYYKKDIRQEAVYLRGLGADIIKHAPITLGVIADIAHTDARPIVQELRDYGVRCVLLSGHSDGAFDVNLLQNSDGTTVHDAEFTDPEHRHNAILSRRDAIIGIAQMIQSQNHPEVQRQKLQQARESLHADLEKERLEREKKEATRGVGKTALSGL